MAKKSKKLKSQIVDKVVTLLTAAFGLVAALAWNDAVRSLFAEGGALYLFSKYGPWVYAVIVTIIAIMVTLWLAKIAEKTK